MRLLTLHAIKGQHRMLLDTGAVLRLFRPGTLALDAAGEDPRTLHVPMELAWGPWDVALCWGSHSDPAELLCRTVAMDAVMRGELSYCVPAPAPGVSELQLGGEAGTRVCRALRGLDRGIVGGVPRVRCVGGPEDDYGEAGVHVEVVCRLRAAPHDRREGSNSDTSS